MWCSDPDPHKKSAVPYKQTPTTVNSNRPYTVTHFDMYATQKELPTLLKGKKHKRTLPPAALQEEKESYTVFSQVEILGVASQSKYEMYVPLADEEEEGRILTAASIEWRSIQQECSFSQSSNLQSHTSCYIVLLVHDIQRVG